MVVVKVDLWVYWTVEKMVGPMAGMMDFHWADLSVVWLVACSVVMMEQLTVGMSVDMSVEQMAVVREPHSVDQKAGQSVQLMAEMKVVRLAVHLAHHWVASMVVPLAGSSVGWMVVSSVGCLVGYLAAGWA